MRITNSMLISNYVKNLNRNNTITSKMQAQISSGKKLTRSSDDPLAANKAMGIRSNLSKIAQYTNNVMQAQQWLKQSETSLTEVSDLLTRVNELNVKASSGTNGPDERASIANEIGQITEQIVQSANTVFVGRYVFGGFNTSKEPFEVRDVAGEKVLFYNGENVNELSVPENAAVLADLESQKINYMLGFGTSMDISYNGTEIMGTGEDNLFAVLNNLKNALMSGNADTVENSMEKIEGHKSNMLSRIGEIGGKTNRLDAFATRLENDKYNYEEMQEKIEGIDIYEVILNMQLQEVVYQAALSSGSKVISRTLADFI